MRSHRHPALLQCTLALVTIVIAIASLCLGQYPLSLAEVFRQLAHLSPLDGVAGQVVWSVRLPRIVMALLAGGALGLCGATLQGVFQNPLVDPHIIGVTSGSAFGGTLAILLGLNAALDRVIAIVVQPGVEFDHTQIIHYQPEAAKALSAWIESTPMVYEAHSTDYQSRQAYRALVRDHYAILKVGPALTFALREAIFALAQMENELVAPESRSRVMEVIDEVMLNEPGYWQKYYRPTWSQAMVDIHFSLSDRIRYYWPHPRIRQSVEKLMANLTETKLPLGLISQYMPVQFERLSLNELSAVPHDLILDKIQDVLRAYRYGCSSEIA